MKTLSILRHAASSCSCNGGDHERQLDTRGLRERHVIASAMAGLGIVPDMIICSTAARAQATAAIVAEAFGIGAEQIRHTHLLYLAEQDAICTEIASVLDGCQHLLVVGHNPGLSDFTNAHTDLEYAVFPTCGLVTATFAIHTWSQIFTAKGAVSAHIWPDMFE